MTQILAIPECEKFCLCNAKHFRRLFQKWIDQANKRLSSQAGCPKNENSPILVQNDKPFFKMDGPN